MALDLRIQCHRLSDAALVITAPGRLVLFAQRSPWCGSSRLDVPDLRPAQTRTTTSPHPLCAAPLPARLGSQLAKVHRGEWVRGHRHKKRGGETGGPRQRGEALRWRDEAPALDGQSAFGRTVAEMASVGARAYGARVAASGTRHSGRQAVDVNKPSIGSAARESKQAPTASLLARRAGWSSSTAMSNGARDAGAHRALI